MQRRDTHWTAHEPQQRTARLFSRFERLVPTPGPRSDDRVLMLHTHDCDGESSPHCETGVIARSVQSLSSHLLPPDTSHATTHSFPPIIPTSSPTDSPLPTDTL